VTHDQDLTAILAVSRATGPSLINLSPDPASSRSRASENHLERRDLGRYTGVYEDDQ
jgi:hypothetical protein